MLIVFLLIGILHFATLRLINLPEKKKQRFRKIFWYPYGLLFIVQGIVNMYESKEVKVLSVVMCICGVLLIVLNLTGKISPKNKS